MSPTSTNQPPAGWGQVETDEFYESASGFGISRVGLVILTVHDPQKALRFYRDTLGMKVRSMTPGWVELDGGGVILALHPHDIKRTPKEGELPSVVFDVEDMQDAYDQLKSRGVKFVTEPRVVHESPTATGVAATFLDPDFNVLSIYSTIDKNPRVL